MQVALKQSGRFAKKSKFHVSLKIALCCVLMLATPAPRIFAADAAGAQDATGAGIIFDGPGSLKLLEEVEACRTQIPLLQSLVEKDGEVDEIRVEREKLYQERIVFLKEQNDILLKMNDQAIKQAELSRKAGEGSWWEQAVTVLRWVLPVAAGAYLAGAAQ